MRGFWISAGVALLMALGCSGLIGYGQEITSTQVQPGAPFSLAYQSTKTEPYNLWLDYSVSHTGNDFSITGPITATAQTANIGTWPMSLNRNGSPVSGGRFVINSSSSMAGGNGNARATIFLVELPAQAAGTAVTVTGTFTPAPGTTVQNLRLVVTD